MGGYAPEYVSKVKSTVDFSCITKPCSSVMLNLEGNGRDINVNLTKSIFKGFFSIGLTEIDNGVDSHTFRILLGSTTVLGSTTIHSIAKTVLQLDNFNTSGDLTLCGKYERIFLEGTIIGQILKLYKFEYKNGTREDYNFIKSNLLKSNNRIEALKYNRLEMKSYLSSLLPKLNFKSKKLNILCNRVEYLKTLLKKSLILNSDFWILLLSGLSNKHGTSWTRGVTFTFFVGIFFFILFNYNLGKPLFVIGWDGWESFYNVMKLSNSKFINFLYVGHSTDFMKENSPNDWATFFDFAGRIFIGFGYYQTITAFRKFGKLNE